MTCVVVVESGVATAEGREDGIAEGRNVGDMDVGAVEGVAEGKGVSTTEDPVDSIIKQFLFRIE